MKSIIKTVAFMLAAIALTGCHKDSTDGLTKITYYPTITVLGDPVVVVLEGSTYTDEGCYVDLNGEDFTDQATTSSNVDASKIGIYTVTYSAVNEDGFAASASRKVYVVNPNSFASVYYGESAYGTRHYYDAPIIITQRANGTYLIDDLAGGFYFYGRYPGYEPTYDFHLEAVLVLEADNSVSLAGIGSWYWDGNTMELTSGTFDPDTQTITLELDFGGTPMYVTLTGIQ